MATTTSRKYGCAIAEDDDVARAEINSSCDVATTISRKYGYATTEDDDVARANVNSSYFMFIKKQTRCTTARFLLPGSYFQFIKKQTRRTTTRFLLPGSYFLFIKKQMSCQSSLQTDYHQAKDATEKHSEGGGELNETCTRTLPL